MLSTATVSKVSLPSSSSSSSLGWQQSRRRFTLDEIKLATNNFKSAIAVGGFGVVYKGTFFDGSTPVIAAIKRLAFMSNQGAKEFWAEVEILSKLRHRHLVSLIGYCNEDEEMILVYEYMRNGSLEEHLHRRNTPLSWLQRLKICIDAALGLDYLHAGTGNIRVIHRDVKSSNILLQESWEAKISDFGLSRSISQANRPVDFIMNNVAGTFGYIDPQYFDVGILTTKSDVYSFGVVLFEVLCRKPAVDRSLEKDRRDLVRWVQESIKEGRLKHIIDYDLRDQISPQCLKEFVRMADSCLHSHPNQRPTMAEVVVSLESILALQEKINNSFPHFGRNFFGRMFDMFLFPCRGENSAHGDSKLSSNSNDPSRSAINTVGPNNNMFLDKGEVPADGRIPSPSLKDFKLADLKSATRAFGVDMLLNETRSEKVFLGWVDKNTFAPSEPGVGIAIAVKMCSQKSGQMVARWQTEVSLLGRLAHPNIISLLGHCPCEKEMLLVYEYIPNRSLDRFLFDDAPVAAESLSWRRRLTIMIGVAQGLDYLHSSKDQILLQSLLISSYIMLDQDFNAKLGGFQLARSGPEFGNEYVSTIVKGNPGYMSPEYAMTGYSSTKSDIYSFGVVLLETLTGLRVIDHKRPEEQWNLVSWARPILAQERELEKMVDPRLEQDYPKQGAFELAALTLRCLADKPKDRPSSGEVFQSLEQIYAVHK